MNPLIGASGLAGGGALRTGGVMDMLKPLDYPRQALANLVRGGTGNGSLLGMLPGLLGGVGGAMLGGPFGALAGSGIAGAAQGLGLASGSDDFNAPTAGDVSQELGFGDSPLASGLVGALTDPLSYATIGLGRARGTAAALGPESQLGVQQVEMANELQAMKDGVMRQGSEAAALGQAQQQFGQAQGGIESLLNKNYPAPPIPGMNGGVTMADIGAAATDPRLPYVEYNPASQFALPNTPNLSTGRVGRDQAGAVSGILDSLGVSSGTGVQPGGKVSYLANPGELPPGLQSGRGGWMSPIGPTGQPADLPPLNTPFGGPGQEALDRWLPPPDNTLMLGQVPPGVKLPPGVGRPAMPSMQGMLSGGDFPEASQVAQQMGMGGSDAYNLRKMLAGIGDQGGTSVMDMPLDQATSLLGQQAGGARGKLQQLLAQIQALPPDKQALFTKMFPDLAGGAAPAFPNIGPQQLGQVNYGVR